VYCFVGHLPNHSQRRSSRPVDFDLIEHTQIGLVDRIGAVRRHAAFALMVLKITFNARKSAVEFVGQTAVSVGSVNDKIAEALPCRIGAILRQ
jgi:hypothetical protein